MYLAYGNWLNYYHHNYHYQYILGASIIDSGIKSLGGEAKHTAFFKYSHLNFTQVKGLKVNFYLMKYVIKLTAFLDFTQISYENSCLLLFLDVGINWGSRIKPTTILRGKKS